MVLETGFIHVRKKTKTKAFKSRAFKRNAGVFILAVVTLSRCSTDSCAEEELSAAALKQGCPSSGSERALAPSNHKSHCQIGLFNLLYQKRDSPTHFFSPCRSAGERGRVLGVQPQGCHAAHREGDVQTEPIGLGKRFLFNLRVKSGCQTETRKEEGAVYTVTTRSCDCWHRSHLPGCRV